MIVTATMVAAVAALIYLVDCVVLVERGQAVIQVGYPGLTADFGSRYYVFRERPIVLLNPLTPWRLGVKSASAWAAPPYAGSTIGRFKKLRPIAFVCTVQGGLVLVVGPALLHFAPGWPFLIAVVAAVFLSVTIAAILWKHRLYINLPMPTYLNLVVGGLICLPLSVNLARKATLASPAKMTALQMLRFLRSSRRDDARTALVAQLEEARLATDDQSERWTRLTEILKTLEQEHVSVGR